MNDHLTGYAARLLLLEAAAIAPILDAAQEHEFDLPTVCEGWSVRDVIAHCAAALTQTASDDLHSFSPEDNQVDVDIRRARPVVEVVAELVAGYEAAAAVIHDAAGKLDGIAVGEWMHGGDIRDALGLPGAYTSEGIELALELLLERSQRMTKRAVAVHLANRILSFGIGESVGTLTTDTETFVRLCGGRRPDPGRYSIKGDFTPDDLVLFN